MTDEKDEYPEHTRLKAVNAETQAAYDFYEWLGGQGIFLAERYEGRSYPAMKSIDTLLAEWKGIDRDKIEQEKRAMLAKIRGEA